VSEVATADPFGTGPFQSLLHRLGLPSGAEGGTARRAILSIVIAWVPLLVLAQVQGLAIGTGTASLLEDYAAYSRFLVAGPLMVLAESQARYWLQRTLGHFIEARLVAPEQDARFQALLDSTRRLLSSRVVLVVIVVLAYALTLASAREWVQLGAANWTLLSHPGEPRVVSYAGWWRLLVSQPLFMCLVLTWFWRLYLWMRCMRTIAHMKVRIVASHPDKAGGLAFLGQSLRGFPVLALALGTAIAGTLANVVMHDTMPSTALTPVVVATVIFILFICAGPLLTFIKPMREAQDDAELNYGALATSLGKRLEGRWLPQAETVGDEALGVPDFSATADLYSIAAKVDEMRPIPIQLKDFFPLLVATLLPFLPIILRQVSFSELLEVSKRLLM
jgi:hypothetical protein